MSDQPLAAPRLTIISAWFISMVGMLVLFGWHFDNEALKALSPRLTAMNPVTALAFISCGLSLFFFVLNRRRLSLAFAAVVLLISFLKILSFVGFDMGIDRMLFTEKLELTALKTPNRMAPNTTLAFLLSGFALLLLHFNILYSQLCTALALIISLLALVGYIYGVTPLTQILYFIPMALNTALTFVVLCIGLFVSHLRQGLMVYFTNNDAGGFLLRRVLPAVVLVPILLGWISLSGEEAQLFSGRYSIALVAVGSILTIAGVMFWNARYLSRASRQVTELNEQLKQNLRELALLNKELEAFSYSVSHDLKAPLRSISGFSAIILEEEKNLSTQGSEYLQKIINATKKMGELIEGLLDLARLSRQEIYKTEVSLSNIAQGIAKQLYSTNPQRKVEFQIKDNISATGDARLLEIVLQNLLNNAWKYTSKKANAKIEFSQSEKDGKPLYIIQDNGAGFNMEYSDRLFGTFQRLHSSSEFEGTGIGLATVSRIIKKHGGNIWAEGKPSEGATFYFTL